MSGASRHESVQRGPDWTDARRATGFVVLLGVVSLFSDMTYESARSIIGPFLESLGASATVVGIVAGLAELIGYSLRLVSGGLTDRSGRYWAITIFGYLLNLLSVPLLALAGSWQAAVLLMFLERAGKAMRSPPRDAMLSFAGQRMGQGWGFALHEAMDQTGATVGPLIVGGVLFLRHDYRTAFAVLALPAILAISTLLLARHLHPHPRDLAPAGAPLVVGGFGTPFRRYLLAMAFVAIGFADYTLIAFHFGRTGSVPTSWIPIFYAIAMFSDALAALLLGRFYDRNPATTLVAAVLVPLPAVPLAFYGGFTGALCGVVLWGIGMGAQESVYKAAVASLSPTSRRGTAFGLYNLCFGLAWFGGSALMGLLYDHTLAGLVIFSVASQAISLPILLALTGRNGGGSSGTVSPAP